MVYFVTLDHDVLVQHIADISPSCDTLLAARTPYFYFNAKIDLSTEPENKEKKKDDCELRINKFLIRATWPVFAGLENCDSECKSAAIDFIIHSTAGDMNEALKVIRSIKRDESSSVSNAYLGNSMRFALEDSSDPNVQLGLLAEQLNLQEEQSCFSLLRNIFQAVEIAESHDRIHLKNTCYHYAQFLEKSGETNKAIEWYEKASVAHAEIPRLLLPFLSRLEEYVREKKDLRLFQWLAKYKESNDDMDGAVSYYLEAKNFSSLLRILCHQGKIEEACKHVQAQCVLPRKAATEQHVTNLQTSVKRIKAPYVFTSFVSKLERPFKECHFDDRIVDLALKATNSVMIDAAKYYGKRQGMVDKAVMLYHKAGLHDEAMSLASQTEQFTAMNLVASELKQQADPMMLDKCAQFFLQNKQYSKAVELLAEAKRVNSSAEVNNIPLNEKMADLMTPSKEDSKLRNELIEELGDSCMKQGLYSCAAKKYIQAGVRRKAMKALIINGDWQKIVLFTNAAKSRELYIIAANYLCTLDWHATPEISNSIVQFYKKASAYEQLANFYCLWAKERMLMNVKLRAHLCFYFSSYEAIHFSQKVDSKLVSMHAIVCIILQCHSRSSKRND
ncbi:hypothetical protein TTRE_0000120001 [Trichuris trichiura]|uniref:IF140/IFT172/WDR19 TPR domain-containing protein n=1 Tax=Trichuris trichiura TaxID=36087 RepID=A0A077YZP5_TRITR|nr:hypothetical protein TTRE_0000120001 [Trichuris trichiura]